MSFYQSRGLSVSDEAELAEKPWLEAFLDVDDVGLGNARARHAKAQRDAERLGPQPAARMEAVNGVLTTCLDPSRQAHPDRSVR